MKYSRYTFSNGIYLTMMIESFFAQTNKNGKRDNITLNKILCEDEPFFQGWTWKHKFIAVTWCSWFHLLPLYDLLHIFALHWVVKRATIDSISFGILLIYWWTYMYYIILSLAIYTSLHQEKQLSLLNENFQTQLILNYFFKMSTNKIYEGVYWNKFQNPIVYMCIWWYEIFHHLPHLK